MPKPLVPADMTGRIARPEGRPGSRYRTAETYLVRYRTPPSSDLDTYLVRASDAAVLGPYGSLEAAEEWVGRHGGGYVDWGRSASLVPDRGGEGQLALLHKANGCPWWDWRQCEDRPRAFIQCGHSAH